MPLPNEDLKPSLMSSPRFQRLIEEAVASSVQQPNSDKEALKTSHRKYDVFATFEMNAVETKLLLEALIIYKLHILENSEYFSDEERETREVVFWKIVDVAKEHLDDVEI